VSSRRIEITAFALAALFAWCGWVSGFHRATTPAIATWVVSAVAVVVLDVVVFRGFGGRRPIIRLTPVTEPWPASRARARHATLAGVAPWLVLLVVTVCWEILGIDTGPGVPHLTISALSEAFRPLNAALLLVWMSIGLGYGVTRARTPRSIGSRPTESASGSAAVGAGVIGVGHRGGSAIALLLPHVRAAGVIFWIGVVVVGAAIDLAGRASDGRTATAEQFVRAISGTKPARIALIAAWLFAGWHLFAS
jgi:Family of unknown function (DUF6186)